MDGPRRALWRVLVRDPEVDPGSEAGMIPPPALKKMLFDSLHEFSPLTARKQVDGMTPSDR